jgi:hypothetical protein
MTKNGLGQTSSISIMVFLYDSSAIIYNQDCLYFICRHISLAIILLFLWPHQAWAGAGLLRKYIVKRFRSNRLLSNNSLSVTGTQSQSGRHDVITVL